MNWDIIFHWIAGGIFLTCLGLLVTVVCFWLDGRDQD